MVGTTRFELATSPTPILETTQSEQLSQIHQYVRERETTRRNAYWTRNGPTVGPMLAHAIDNAARTATSKGAHLALRNPDPALLARELKQQGLDF